MEWVCRVGAGQKSAAESHAALPEPGAAKDEERRHGQVSRREQRKPRSSEQRASGRERPTRTEVQTSVKDEVKDVHGESVKDAEAEEEVGEERISVSLLRETSGLSRVRAPTPIVIGELVSLGFTPMHLR